MGSVVSGVGEMLGAGTGGSRYNVNSQAFAPNAQEQAYTDRLIALSQGQGPSVAQAQMQQGLDEANAQALGLAASQHGINPGLAARLAAQAQSQNNMMANQQLGQLRAQESLGNNQLLGQSLQSQRAGRMSEQALQSGAYEGAAGRASNALSSFGTALTSGSSMGGGGHYQGGMIPEHLSAGGPVGLLLPPPMNFADPVAIAAQAIGTQIGSQYAKSQAMSDQGAEKFQKSMARRQRPQAAAPAKVSPFDQDFQSVDQAIAPGAVGKSAQLFPDALLAAGGGRIPGRAFVQGNSPVNDTVPAELSPGEIVLPRTIVAQGPEAAKRFVEELLKRSGRRVV